MAIAYNILTLIEKARNDVPRHLLRDTSLPIADIAASMDYADAAVFTRAFKRWSGVSPRAWRRSPPGR